MFLITRDVVVKNLESRRKIIPFICFTFLFVCLLVRHNQPGFSRFILNSMLTDLSWQCIGLYQWLKQSQLCAENYYLFITYFLKFEAHMTMYSDYSLLCAQGTCLMIFRVPYREPGTEPKWVFMQGQALTPVQSLWLNYFPLSFNFSLFLPSLTFFLESFNNFWCLLIYNAF